MVPNASQPQTLLLQLLQAPRSPVPVLVLVSSVPDPALASSVLGFRVPALASWFPALDSLVPDPGRPPELRLPWVQYELPA